jgi:DUF2911 family protein
MTRPSTRSARTMTFGALVLFATTSGCRSSPPPMTCAPWGSSEDVAKRPSPYDSVVATVDSSTAKLCYSRPFARDRVVFGGLVPYDTLWRTGANEPTILHLSAPADVGGMAVEKGAYSIYTVPSAAGWTMVLNTSISQWGLTREERGAGGNLFPNAYTAEVRAQEVGRAPIQTQAVEYTDQLTAGLRPSGESMLELTVDWEETRIVIPIRFTGRPEGP